MDEKKCCREPSPLMLINEISKIFHNHMRLMNETMGLQGSYRHLLFHLAIQDGVTQLDLVKLTHLKPPTVSVTLQKMERDGLVIRKSDENDLRQTHVYLTEKGYTIDVEIRKKIEEIELGIMKDIPQEKLDSLCVILKNIRAAVLEKTKEDENGKSNE